MKDESEWAEPPERGWGWSSYSEMVESTGLEIVVHHVMGDYQGDAACIVRDGGNWGFLTYGYGSCSGCDALQACQTVDEYKDLRRRLYDSIVWKDTPTELAEWLLGRDWEGQWYGGQSGFVLTATATLQPVWKFSRTSLSLLANEECPPEIAADSLEEDGYPHIAKGLRDAHSQWSVKSLLLRELERVGMTSKEHTGVSDG